ncbi:hypothetical protein ACW9HW_06755 [Pseudomonas sp. SDO5532_S415]
MSYFLGGLKKIINSTWKFFTGVIVAVIAFAANFTDFKQPDVTVEITSVTTTSSKPLDLPRITELSSLAELLDANSRIFPRQDNGTSVEEIKRQLQIKRNSLDSATVEVDRADRQLSDIASGANEELSLTELISKINPFFSNDEELQGSSSRIAFLREKAKKLIKDGRDRNTNLAVLLEKAEKQWNSYQTTVLPDLARLEVTAAIGNRGAGATSLKPQGLLRANLGDGNYLDVSMKLSGYETSSNLAELQSKSFKVVRFQSDELQTMNPADRQRFKTFLGNVSPATIYVVDVRGNTYFSNSVPFSPGVYEQKVYDSLKQYATEVSSK